MQAICNWVHPNGRIIGLPNGRVKSPPGTNPAKIHASRMGRTIKKLAAGDAHSLYVTADGTLWAMGWNTSGQLGNGSLNNANLPLPVAGGALVAANLARGSEASASLAVAEPGPSLQPVIIALAIQPNSGGPGWVVTLSVNPSQAYSELVIINTNPLRRVPIGVPLGKVYLVLDPQDQGK